MGIPLSNFKIAGLYGVATVLACTAAPNWASATTYNELRQQFNETAVKLRKMAWNTSCIGDVKSVCGDVEIGRGRIYQCLLGKQDQLTKECKKTLLLAKPLVDKMAEISAKLSRSPNKSASAATKRKYSAKVPAFVMTPDKVETKTLGTLEFFDGMPSPDTARKVYDHLDLTRGVTSFLDGIPITSMYAMLRGLREAGVKPGEVGMTETLLDARTLLLTPNTTTIYILSQLDLSDGPVVVESPPKMLGFVNDAAFQDVIDIGVAGPDKGKGGKFLFIPPGYKGDIPEG